MTQEVKFSDLEGGGLVRTEVCEALDAGNVGGDNVNCDDRAVLIPNTILGRTAWGSQNWGYRERTDHALQTPVLTAGIYAVLNGF